MEEEAGREGPNSTELLLAVRGPNAASGPEEEGGCRTVLPNKDDLGLGFGAEDLGTVRLDQSESKCSLRVGWSGNGAVVVVVAEVEGIGADVVAGVKVPVRGDAAR